MAFSLNQLPHIDLLKSVVTCQAATGEMRQTVTKRDLGYLNQNMCVNLAFCSFQEHWHQILSYLPLSYNSVFFATFSLQTSKSVSSQLHGTGSGVEQCDFSHFSLPFPIPNELAVVEEPTTWMAWQPMIETHLHALLFLNTSDLSTLNNSPSKDLSLPDSL